MAKRDRWNAKYHPETGGSGYEEWQKVTVRIPESDIEQLDALADAAVYESRSAAIRQGISVLLDSPTDGGTEVGGMDPEGLEQLTGKSPSLRDWILWSLCEDPGQLVEIQDRIPSNPQRGSVSSGLHNLRSQGLVDSRSTVENTNGDEWHLTDAGRELVVLRADAWRTAALNLEYGRPAEEARTEQIKRALAEKSSGPPVDAWMEGDQDG